MARIKKADKNLKVNQLFRGMKKSIADSFTETQRKALEKSITTQDW
jgi:hypothetical protein